MEPLKKNPWREPNYRTLEKGSPERSMYLYRLGFVGSGIVKAYTNRQGALRDGQGTPNTNGL